MATLLLTAGGTLVGGPLGGALGALAGREIDSRLIGSNGREGPRLKELALTTSSYGTPIARHYGRMRVPGTIIWSTDLIESSETSGGGKGRPQTTAYSYHASFAVLLASRPIERVGRIWADGNLLRGAAGDLKAGGKLRVHHGRGDQPVDPLLASAEGDRCPAFRGMAYAVFENLELGGFGNRIPAMSFEVIADEGGADFERLVETVPVRTNASGSLDGLIGFSLEGGSLAQALARIDSVYPVSCDSGGEYLRLTRERAERESAPLLPAPAVAGDDGDFGGASGWSRHRDTRQIALPGALRYYDVGRDYQPGLQRAEGTAGQGHAGIEFPGSMSADTARGLANAAANRARWLSETILWRVAELDPAIAPGTVVRLPGQAGHWHVAGWEWRERGVELELVRLPPISAEAGAGDPGRSLTQRDHIAGRTWLRAFELPWDGTGRPEKSQIYAAGSSDSGGWAGAALFWDRRGELVEAGLLDSRRCVAGTIVSPLGPSRAMLFEAGATIEMEALASDMAFSRATPTALANGANRILVGREILQFADAAQTGERLWTLQGLLRGRGGTEAAAFAGHAAGEAAILLDGRLARLDPTMVPGTRIAAIGRGDAEPVFAELDNAGASLRPLAPVHPLSSFDNAGNLHLAWTRRARGGWAWPDEVELPLIEQDEIYSVGLGPVEAPIALWQTVIPRLTISAVQILALASGNPAASLWVRQVGTAARSEPLLLANAGFLQIAQEEHTQ